MKDSSLKTPEQILRKQKPNPELYVSAGNAQHIAPVLKEAPILKFPQGFAWGAGSSAYQIEGAWNEDGKGPSIWDTFTRIPGKISDGSNGDLACDSYHKYKEDVKLIRDLGIGTYRFSISWPRVMPNGTGPINEKGLKFYHDFADELIANNIEPVCTLYHWDLPQALQDIGGWENRETINAFVDYAKLIFREFNGKIKIWIPVNEPWCSAFLGHFTGIHAPGKKDLQAALTSAHNIMIAQGETVKVFREMKIEGKIGHCLNLIWHEPYSTRSEDVAAAKRAAAWFNEWFLDPVFKGSYPQFMVEWYKSKGANVDIQPSDMEAISQPVDFLGINYYSGSMIAYQKDAGLLDTAWINEGYQYTDIGWAVYPSGLYKILIHIKQNYGNIPIYITENGACYNDMLEDEAVKDKQRVEYLRHHLLAIHRALASGVDVKGYSLWCLMDNFEWSEGYTKRFGLVYVDFTTLRRFKKDSFNWYKEVVAKNGIRL